LLLSNMNRSLAALAAICSPAIAHRGAAYGA
jgi:hypothetical protein